MDSIPTCTFKQTSCSGGIGAIIIEGLVFPDNAHFDPLAKIWSSCRKRIRESYKLDVTGLFLYDRDKQVISCSFCLSFTMEGNEDLHAYIKRFEDNFDNQMAMFKTAIDNFIKEPNDGYNTYCELSTASKVVNKDVYEQMFNRFLRSIGYKTDKDEEEKAKRKAKNRLTTKRRGSSKS